MKEAILYKKLKNQVVQCQNCSHYCVLEEGERGKCGVRENRGGELYALNYGKIIASHIDPIEKKPFFHFLPGSYSLSIATVGCNFTCLFCQNWEISQKYKKADFIPGENLSPQEIIEIAKRKKVESISYTYTEPTIFSDFALDVMRLAKKERIKNNWVSNGFWSKELFELISDYLDAVNVDLKSFEDEFYQKICGARLNPVLENLKRLREKKIWTEITTLIIPTLNDKEENLERIAKFIKNELGSETPWHVTQFCGEISWKLKNIPNTPLETLRRAYEIGKKVGLKFVYTGNVPGLSSENTYCPECSTLCISRIGYHIERYDKKGKCPKCGEDLNLTL